MPEPPTPFACTYLIASHTEPRGVARLARTIVDESRTACVIVHHDAAAGRFPAELFGESDRIAIVDDPVVCRWGTFSLVELVIRSLRQSRRAGAAGAWVVLISGQDYPVRPLRDLEAMLAQSQADAFMEFVRIAPSDRHLNDRYRFLYTPVSDGPLLRIVRVREFHDRVFNRLQPWFRLQSDPRGSFVGRRRRRSVMDLQIPVYKGSQWWAFSRAAVDAILETLENRPDFVERYAGTLIPDESFFQTIVANTASLTASNAVLHYADWRVRNSSPRFLTADDLPAIRASQRWFARKIDAERDGGLRDALDALRGASLLERAN